MILYVGLLLFILLWIFFEKVALKREAFIIPCVALILFATLRDYTIGTDTATYTRFFRDAIDVNYYVFDPRIEYGYQFFVYLLLHISKQYYILFLASSLIIVPSTLYIIKKYSVNYSLSVFIYIAFAFYTFYFNTLRQGLAIAICMLGLYFFIYKKTLPYFLIVLLASTFHVSSWIMLLIYFMVHFVNIRIELKALISFLITFIGINFVIQLMAQDNDRYSHYTEQADNAGGYLLMTFYSIIALFIYLNGKYLRQNNELFRVLEQTFIVGLTLVIPIVLIGTDPSGPQRILYFFSFYVIFLIPLVLERYKSSSINLIFIILSTIYFCLVTQSLYEIYPYVLNPIFSIF